MRDLGVGPLVSTTALAAVVSAAATALVRMSARRLGLMDRASVRSSHVGEVARGGGLGLLAGTLAGLGVFAARVDEGPVAGAVFAGALVVAAVGLLDDRGGLSPWARLVAHTAAAILVVRAAGGFLHLPLPAPLDPALPLGGAVLAVVWIVAVVNFYNFLDGIDGLAGLQAVVTGVALAIAGWSAGAAFLGAAVAGAAVGFLFHNWSPARVFLGDVGSGTLGFVFAAAPFLAPPPARSRATDVVALSLFLFLADATFTLAHRLRRGQRVHEAHREHLYQRLVGSGWTHARVTLLLCGAAVVVTGLTLVGWRHGGGWDWTAFAVALVAFAAELWLVHREGLRNP